MLPSEFKNQWEDMAQKYITDSFMDFFDDSLLTFHLIQELYLICLNLVEIIIHKKVDSITENLNIPLEIKIKVIYSLRTFFNEYNIYIFENPKENEEFTDQIIEEYKKRVLSLDEMKKRMVDFEQMIKSKYFKDLLLLIKKLMIYIKFHDPPLSFNIENNCLDRKLEFKIFKNSDCYCVDGFAKENKNCLVILKPPLFKNNFSYQGLKYIVIFCDDNKIFQENYINLFKINKGLDNSQYESATKIAKNNRNKVINNTNIDLEKSKTTFKKDNFSSFEKNLVKKSIKNEIFNLELLKSSKKLNLKLNNLLENRNIYSNKEFSTNRNKVKNSDKKWKKERKLKYFIKIK